MAIRKMIQRCLAIFTSDFREVFFNKVESQYLLGSDSFFGHAINGDSLPVYRLKLAPQAFLWVGLGTFRLESRCAGRTRTAAKREPGISRLPCRQAMSFQAAGGRARANSFTELG
jgi:hypothetical protein